MRIFNRSLRIGAVELAFVLLFGIAVGAAMVHTVYAELSRTVITANGCR